MDNGPFYTFSDVGRKLRLDRRTVADLVRRWGIPYVHKGPCKCLDVRGFARLRAHLESDPEPALSA